MFVGDSLSLASWVQRLGRVGGPHELEGSNEFEVFCITVLGLESLEESTEFEGHIKLGDSTEVGRLFSLKGFLKFEGLFRALKNSSSLKFENPAEGEHLSWVCGIS